MNITLHSQSIPVEKKQWILVLAIKNNALIGSCTIDRPEKECPTIVALYVNKDHRNRGVATKIIEACCKYVKSKNKKTISLLVNKKNSNAIKLYKKLGFATWFDDDTNIWMAKRLPRF